MAHFRKLHERAEPLIYLASWAQHLMYCPLGALQLEMVGIEL